MLIAGTKNTSLCGKGHFADVIKVMDPEVGHNLSLMRVGGPIESHKLESRRNKQRDKMEEEGEIHSASES